MEPKTDIFHQLDNVIGNSMDGRATDADVIAVAIEANRYLVENPHPDSLLPEDSDKRVAAREALDKRLCDVKKEHAVEFGNWLHNEMDLGFVEPMVPAKPGGLWHISLTRFSGAEEDVVTTAELHKLFADERFKKMSEGKNA